MWNCCFFKKKKDLYKHKKECIYNPYELIQYRELK